MERWLAFAVNDAAASDTVYVASFTWGTGVTGNDPINGLGTANSVGLNNLANNVKGPGSPKNYLITDASTGSVHLDTSTSIYNVMIAETTAGNIHHNKLVVIPGRRAITGSANFTTGAYGDQPNNMLVIKSNFPAAIARFTAQMEEFRNGSDTHGSGIFHDNSASGAPYYFNSPNGDTIEIYFNPDENGHLSTGSGPGNAAVGSGADLEGVVIRVIQEAQQSIFYGINQTNMDQSNFLPNPIQALIAATPGKLVEGWLDSDNSGGGVTRGDLQTDHTSRDGNDFFTSEVHHKIMIVDQEIVITGSSNLTSTALSGTFNNDENMVVVHDFRMARKYLEEYRRVMGLLNTEAVGQADSFDTTVPAAPTGFTVAATDTAFYPSWTASTSPDVTRYFLFIDTFPMKQRDIGDTIDQDGDLYYNEDPRGDADGFPSGTTTGNSTANDDDADGTVDEDTWAFPEVQVKGMTATSGAITSRNVGDALASGVSYYFAIVSVDTHGNESLISTFGPLSLAPAAADTRLRVAKNQDVPDSIRARGTANVVVLNTWIRGDTTLGGDTLTRFAVKNLGLSDSRDLTVRLWRDEDNDSAVGATDTMVGQLVYETTTGRYEATWAATDTRVRLGSTGKTFLVTVDLFDTATLGETFQAQVDVRTCSAPRGDSGPASTVTNSGILTIISANQVNVARRGDTPSGSVAKGETAVAMTLAVSWTTPGDTFTSFAIANLGSMTSADVASIRIYEDAGADSHLGTTDTFIGSIPFDAGSTWRTSSLSHVVTGSSLNLLVAVAVASGANGGRTFQGSIPAYEVDCQNADSGPTAAVATTAVFTIPSDIGPDTQIVINEVQANPGAASNIDGDAYSEEQDEEYIEVFNRGAQSVDLSGWYVRTSNAGENLVISSSESAVLQPGWFGVFKSESGPQLPAVFRIFNESGTLVETASFGTNNWTTAAGVMNTSNDYVQLWSRAGVAIDTMAYGTTTNGDRPFYRFLDGLDTPFKLHGAATTPSYGRPNGRFTLTATPTVVNQGESFTITATALDNEGATVTQFTGTVSIALSKGTATPGTSGTFVSGARSESVSISGLSATESITVRVVYNTADTGTVAITVVVTPADTTTRVTLNADLADTSAPRGTDTAVVLKFRVTGETSGAGDTLAVFGVENLGLANDLDLALELWRDENNDSSWTAGVDSKLAALVRSGSTWSTSGLASQAAAYLGSGATAGRNFLVIATIYDTSTVGDTLQLRINAGGVRCAVFDSGPAAPLTNSGKLTIVSANQLLLAKRGDTSSETIAKGDSRVVMTLLVTVSAAGDTLTAFGVVNTGTLTAAGIDAIRIYHDGDADSVLDGPGTDTLIATLPSTGDTGWASAALSYRFEGTTLPILIFLQTSAGASGGATFTGRVEALAVKTTNADSGPLAAVSTTATFGIASDTSPDTAIVLNEFIPDPSGMDHDNDGTTTDADEEFIELYNNSDGPVDVGGWKLDNDLTPGDATLPSGIVIPARGFLVVYDSSTPTVSKDWFLYDSTGRRMLDSGNLAAGSFPGMGNSAGVIVAVANAANAIIDSYTVAATDTPKAGFAFARHFDGASAWDTVASITPGTNSDPTPAYNRSSPNAYVALSATPASITAGESFTLTMTIRTARDSVVTQFTQSLALSSDTGSMLPTASGGLVLGARSDSATVTGIASSGSVVLTASWQTTTGTTAITVTKLATVTAVVALEAGADESGCTGTLANGVDTYVGVSNASGTITFSGVRAGNYTFQARHPTHLQRNVQNLAVLGSDTTFTSVTLIAGDVNQDGRINIIDASAVRAGVSAGVAPTVDVDGSGTVDAADLAWIRRNFGRASN